MRIRRLLYIRFQHESPKSPGRGLWEATVGRRLWATVGDCGTVTVTPEFALCHIVLQRLGNSAWNRFLQLVQTGSAVAHLIRDLTP